MIVLATDNQEKVREMRQILGEEILTKRELGYFESVKEDGNSLEENAMLKARALQAHRPDAYVLADDTGLFVEALDGAPGIYSARFAGEGVGDRANCQKLLEALKGQQNRSAAFETVIVLLGPEGFERIVRGRCEGHILQEPTGAGGFGYDPIFCPEGHEESFAQMSAKEKNKISHRGRALQALREVWETLQ